jgi:disulfide bond formation protein DsbB
MSVETFDLFFALLTFAALAGAAAALVVLVLARGGHGPPAIVRLRDDLRPAALWLAWVVATVTTLGSLYYSEVQDYVPCVLCWYQRIAIYPLAVLLGIAAVRRDVSIRLYVIVQAAIGAVIALYNSWIQWFPPEGGSAFCTLEAPCTQRYVYEFGFVSMPFMALTAFAFVIVMMVLAHPSPAENGVPHE